MCIPALYQAAPMQQQPPQQPVTDSEISPDGHPPLLIRNMQPQAPYGYVARFIEGQWRIVPDPQIYGDAGQGRGGFGLTTQSGGSGGGNGGGGRAGMGN